MAKDINAEIARNEEAIERWFRRLKRATNELDGLRKKHKRLLATKRQVDSERKSAKRNERKQQLPPPKEVMPHCG